ncbi:MAG TPA: cupredoxin family copper-binding protein, partial [Terriglobales bacterium]|nr:cupredoxin family copper-binding protein [Terriglobales bacterium]
EEANAILRKAAAALPAAAAQQTQTKVAATGETVQAAIDNFAFTPKELRIKTGSTVLWTNKDDIPHTVTSDNNVFASPVLDTNQKFQFTFANPGKFPYFCKLHPMMTGVVVVE